jgi:hypothetical protein
VTCRVGEATITVKADKTAQHQIEEPIGIGFDDASAFLFDSTSGERIRSAADAPPRAAAR